MPTYREEVIADLPIAYAGLDDVDPAVTVMTNLGTGEDGTYFSDNIRGIASPIETDPASFAFRNRVGIWPASVEALDNFTWEAWGYNDPSLSSSLIFRGGQVGLGASNFLMIDVGNARFAVTATTGAADLSLHLPEAGWYYLVARRNGTVAELLVNTVLVDSSVLIGVGQLTGWGISILPDTFHLGVGTTSPAFQSFGTDEPAIYDYPLSDARVAAHYAAALNELLLTGVSNVIPSSVLYSDIEPDPISFPFRHNWGDALIERISFKTARSVAVKGYEAGNQLRPKPRRELELQQLIRDNDERQSFRAKLTTQQARKWFIPILEDREQLTATLASGSTLMPATIQYRDYEVGGYVELRQLSATGVVTKVEQVLITALSPLTTTPTVNSYDALASTISPARRGLVEAQVSLRGHTDAVEEVPLVIRLLAEDESVTPNRITPWTPATTYHGYEVFDPAIWQANDWTETRDYAVERERADIDFDTGTFGVESDTLAAGESFSYRMTLAGRDKHAALLGWFYARAGAWSYLWVPTVQRDFTVVSAVGSTLTVTKHNYFDNYAGSEFRRDLAFVYNDNTMVLRRIVSVALDGANEVLTLNTSPPTLSNLRSVSYLRFCRLDGDTLEIARETDTKARFAWGFREMLSSPA